MNHLFNLFVFLLAISTIFYSSGCGNYYGKGISGADYLSMDHPWADAEKVSQLYISANYAEPFLYVPGDENTMGSFLCYKTHAKDGIVWGAGAVAFAGKYNVESIVREIIPIRDAIAETGVYSYAGGAIIGKVGFETKKWKKVKWEYLGIQTEAILEAGSYAQFRKIANTNFSKLRALSGSDKVDFFGPLVLE